MSVLVPNQPTISSWGNREKRLQDSAIEARRLQQMASVSSCVDTLSRSNIQHSRQPKSTLFVLRLLGVYTLLYVGRMIVAV
jgi:hypothetical protein